MSRGSTGSTTVTKAASGSLRGSLGDSVGQVTINTSASPEKTAYYVIVGRGFVGVLNLSTLRSSDWGKGRLRKTGKENDPAPTSDLPVMFIGFEDPWKHYSRHDMGQSPHLVSLPCYRTGATDEDFKKPRNSRLFARDTQTELERMQSEKAFTVQTGWVALIEPKVKEDWEDHAEVDLVIDKLEALGVDVAAFKEFYAMSYPPFRLLVVDPQGRGSLVYAEKIDVCAGQGPPRLLDLKIIKDATAKTRYESKPWIPPEQKTDFRAVVPGQEALYEENQWPSQGRVCIRGAGGIGVNMVEIAESKNKGKLNLWSDWLAAETLHASIDALGGRNDVLLRGGSDANRTAGKLLTSTALVPAYSPVRFGQGCEVESVDPVSGNLLKVTFKQSVLREANKSAPTIGVTDHLGHVQGLEPTKYFKYTFAAVAFNGDLVSRGSSSVLRDNGHYEQLIVPMGLVRDAATPGTPAYMLKFLGPTAPIKAYDDRMCGVELQNGLIRVLGSAGTLYPGVDKSAAHSGPYGAMKNYQDSLPVEGQVLLGGVTFSAVNVAIANQFFTGTLPHVNCNVNTATGEELKIHAKSHGLPQPATDFLVAAVETRRRARAAGYRSFDELFADLGEASATTVDWTNTWRDQRGAIESFARAKLKVYYQQA